MRSFQSLKRLSQFFRKYIIFGCIIQEIGMILLVFWQYNYVSTTYGIDYLIHFLSILYYISNVFTKNKFMHRNLLCNNVFLRLLQQHMYHSVDFTEFHSQNFSIEIICHMSLDNGRYSQMNLRIFFLSTQSINLFSLTVYTLLFRK